MFDLYDKKTGRRTTIYTISEDSCGYPKFLIRKDNQWIWRSAKYYITESERIKIAYSLMEAEEIKILGKPQIY